MHHDSTSVPSTLSNHDSVALPDPWPAPTPLGPVKVTLTLPGSKSLTARYLMLGAFAAGPSRLRAPLYARDTRLMMNALRTLGVRIEEVPGSGSYGPDLVIFPRLASSDYDDAARVPLAGSGTIDCGLAGTVMRFVPFLAALTPGEWTFDGDPAARLRPMGPILDTLRALGVDIRGGENGMLPFTIIGQETILGGPVAIDASGSSQFISAAMLAGAHFSKGLTLTHEGHKVPSVDHIRMTSEALRGLGVRVDDSKTLTWAVSPGNIDAFDIEIEQDLSNAGPFLAAALATHGTVTIERWPAETTQVGDRWREYLPQLGATVTLVPRPRGGQDLVVTGGETITGSEIADSSELAPTLAGLLALADSPSRLTGIAHLRGHETDRLQALVTEINRLGGNARELEDGIEIIPAPLHGGVWESYEDHRMATAGAVVGLAVPDVSVVDIATTSKTLPQFPELWDRVVATAAATNQGSAE
ncbi:3-phosphoshikimate 1-carboxyvinyltransferase [Neomicrococcus aestuarii]|uniref:3-phosphoshikimate 1-carboxyvinyltransferase n=1 Tax=Neomicrococcus aestuarii TaxID=556325 RepID=A0A7W8TXS1_9MICC|nr:3-phosphoshikimate 1-carboxyvinyltransferase [Neomicrococcus aestuarii]